MDAEAENLSEEKKESDYETFLDSASLDFPHNKLPPQEGGDDDF